MKFGNRPNIERRRIGKLCQIRVDYIQTVR